MLRGRAGLTQRALAALTGASERAIQGWEAGHSYPTAAHLQALIAVYLERGVFTPGRVTEDAIELWEAASEAAPRLHAPFDHAWFANLLASTPTPGAEAHWYDWGEAPEIADLHGRAPELAEAVATLDAVPGFGLVSATAVAACLTEQGFTHPDQFVADVGLDIRVHQSGKRNGKFGLSTYGDAELRRLLDLAALGATRNTTDRTFAERYAREQA